ncbi:hypothetical protein J3Q64DRAFT_1720666 [Phycomyces blakesleeanus]|uniref:SET domain-containing protein n=1 Tax=Phycomyces blakesleeanus TaxID=4837 RepID=A0ABR3BB21_PHYBL
MVNSDKLKTLVDWFKTHEIQWDQELIEIRSNNDGYGIYARKDIPKKKRVVKIPKEAVLSAKSTGIANVLDDEGIDGGCSLAISVMYEISQGTDSPWYGYLQALPAGEDLPIFWSDEDKAWLKGTEMDDAVHNDLNDLKEDYEEIVQPLMAKHTYIFTPQIVKEFFSFEKFCKISTLISSRSFEVDAYHENGMVPFADLFNHRSGNEHVHFETDFEVCDACGALEYCEHQFLEDLELGSENGKEGEHDEHWSDVDEEDEDDEEAEDNSDEEVLEDEDEEDEEDNGPLKDLEELEAKGINIWEGDNEEPTKDTCDMVLDRAVKKGEELFNTYGDHPNIVLLSKYGFCHDDNKNDYVSVTEDSIIDACLIVTKDQLVSEGAKGDDEALEMLAIERTRPRWEFFLNNESILCPKEDDEEEEDDFEEDDDHEHGGGCCGDDHMDHDGHGHGHGHSHGHQHGGKEGESSHGHKHDHAGGCCGDEDEEEEEEEEHEHEHGGGCCGGDDDGEGTKSRPYFMNEEGLYEDSLMCLLHIMFVSEEIFATFENVEEALKYFETLAEEGQGRGKKTKKTGQINQAKQRVYQVCKLLSEQRREEYSENGVITTVEEDIKAREKTENIRHRYALTCRISEKQILNKSIAYYEAAEQSASTSEPAKKKSKKGRK